MKTLLYLGSIGSEVSTYGTNLMKICCLIITVFLGLVACVDVPPPPPPPTNIRIASVSVDASRAIWRFEAYKRAYVSGPKLEKAVARAVQRRVSPLAQGSRAVVVTLTVADVIFNDQAHPLDVLLLSYDGSRRLHSRMSANLKIADAQSGELLFVYGRISSQEIIHEKKWPFPKDIQWSENEVNKNLGELAMGLADDVACKMYGVSCASLWDGRRR